MASTYSTNLAIELIGTGDQAGTWGNTTNTNLGTLIEQAISGYVTQAVSTGTDTTITIPNGATGVARNMYIELTGTGGASTNLIVPANKKLYFIFNNTASGQVTVKVSGQTGVSVPNKAKVILVSNGTDVIDATNYIGSATIGNLTATSGTITTLASTSAAITTVSGTTLTYSSGTITNLASTSLTLSNNPVLNGGTANGVLYLNGSKVATSGSALTFDGTILTTARFNVTNTTNGATFNSSGGNGMRLYGSSGTNQWDIYLNSTNLRFSDNTGGGQLFVDTGAYFGGNLGLGVTPSAYNIGRAVEVGFVGNSVFGATATQITLTQNAYYNSAYYYASTNAASRYTQNAGVHSWWNAPSGTAGNAITFTQAMTLDASGRLGIGQTSPGYILDIGVGSGGGINIANTSDSNRGGRLLVTSGGTFAINTSSGIYSMTFGIDSVEKMRLDTSGNLGVGETSPDTRLHIYGASTAGRGQLYIQGSSTTSRFVMANSSDAYSLNTYGDSSTSLVTWDAGSGYSFRWTVADTERARIDSSGNFGVGTSSPAARTHILGANTAARGQLTVVGDGVDSRITLYNSSTFLGVLTSSTSEMTVGAEANIPLRFITNGTERGRFAAGGFFKAQGNSTYISSTSNQHEFISATSNSSVLGIKSNASNGTQYGMYIDTANDQNDATRYFFACNGGGTERATIRSNGGLANYSANNVNLASDERLKKDISPLASTWSKVKNIEVVNFRYKDCNEGDPALYGVIAQQVQPIVPELVVVTREATETDPEYYGIREQPMYWLAIKALQEAMARIEKLEAEVAALKGA